MRKVVGQSATLLLRRVPFAARSLLRHGHGARPFYTQEYRGGTRELVALQRSSPPSGRLPKYTPDRLYAVSGGAPPEQAARNAKSLHQKRCRMLPYLVVQGSRRGCGAGGGAPVWIQGGELLLD